MGIEIELKLWVAVRDLARLRIALQKFAGGEKPTGRRLVSHYFDTPALQFRDSGFALRVRRIDNRWVQTIKGGGGIDAGMHSRAEWESAVDGPRPDLERLQKLFPEDRALARFAGELSRANGLRRVFTTDFHRDAWVLALADGSVIEAAVDNGEVRGGDRSAPITELELELKSGDPVAAMDFARKILREVPLHFSMLSKSQRGYGLLEPGKPQPQRRAQDIRLRAAMPVDEAFARIFTECLNHLLGNVTGVSAGGDAEAIHQMRVAIRRLRGALGVFSDAVPKAVFAQLAGELQKIGLALGDARNHDVLRDETLPAMAKELGSTASSALQARVRRGASRAGLRARRLVGSRSFTDTMLRTSIFVTGRRWREGGGEAVAAALAEPLGEFARRAIAKRHRRLAKRVAALLPGRPETLHAVRIAAKKLRYTMEFFAALFAKRAVKAYLQPLMDLQTILGDVNDAATAERLLDAAAEGNAEMLAEVATIKAALAERSRRDEQRFANIWSRFAKGPALPK
jgi:inorganic triphosphatase YgiF